MKTFRSYIYKFSEKLLTPIDASSLGMFRILFGLLMVWQALYYIEKNRYITYYVKPGFHFTFEFFHFISPLPQPYLRLLFIFMAIVAFGIALGFFYRLCVFFFLVTFTYVFLLDQAYYNNHYYFIILLSFLMLMVNGQQWGSIDSLRKKRPNKVPYWNLFILRAQVFIVYFYGGIAKLNWDWLSGEPMRSWLYKQSHLPVIGPWLLHPIAPYFFSWGGLLFDLSIGFLLLCRKTRYWAFVVVLFFNLTNSYIFHIGVFPFLMIAATTLFDDPDWPRRIFNKQTSMASLGEFHLTRFQRRFALTFVGFYLVIQAIIPLRHWLYPGNVSWTEEGHFFSWHMKLRDKDGRLKVWLTDPRTNETTEVDPNVEINKFQWKKLVQRPQFIYQYAQHVKQNMEKQGVMAPIVHVDALVSLNGRPFQQMIDPQANLAAVAMKPFSHNEWILPLDEKLKPGSIEPPGFEDDQPDSPFEGEGSN